MHLIKTCENEEALSTLCACHVVANRFESVPKRLQADLPKYLKSFCVALRGFTGKRPALFPTDHQISSKRRALTQPDKKKQSFKDKCSVCGKIGHK